jgi:hypothetical protein
MKQAISKEMTAPARIYMKTLNFEAWGAEPIRVRSNMGSTAASVVSTVNVFPS